MPKILERVIWCLWAVMGAIAAGTWWWHTLPQPLDWGMVTNGNRIGCPDTFLEDTVEQMCAVYQTRSMQTLHPEQSACGLEFCTIKHSEPLVQLMYLLSLLGKSFVHPNMEVLHWAIRCSVPLPFWAMSVWPKYSLPIILGFSLMCTLSGVMKSILSIAYELQTWVYGLMRAFLMVSSDCPRAGESFLSFRRCASASFTVGFTSFYILKMGNISIARTSFEVAYMVMDFALWILNAYLQEQLQVAVIVLWLQSWAAYAIPTLEVPSIITLFNKGEKDKYYVVLNIEHNDGIQIPTIGYNSGQGKILYIFQQGTNIVVARQVGSFKVPFRFPILKEETLDEVLEVLQESDAKRKRCISAEPE